MNEDNTIQETRVNVMTKHNSNNDRIFRSSPPFSTKHKNDKDIDVCHFLFKQPHGGSGRRKASSSFRLIPGFFEFINLQNSNISFKIEHPDADGGLCLLDFRVIFDPSSRVMLHGFGFTERMLGRTSSYSAIPRACKSNAIINEKRRIIERCSIWDEAQPIS